MFSVAFFLHCLFVFRSLLYIVFARLGIHRLSGTAKKELTTDVSRIRNNIRKVFDLSLKKERRPPKAGDPPPLVNQCRQNKPGIEVNNICMLGMIHIGMSILPLNIKGSFSCCCYCDQDYYH